MGHHIIMVIWIIKIFFVLFFFILLSPLNIFSFREVHTISVLYYAHLCMKCCLGVCDFLEEISCLSRSVVFLYFLALIAEEGFVISLAIIWNSAFKWVYLSFSPFLFASLLFTAICKASSDNHFAFLHFFFLGMVLITASYAMSHASVHHSSSTLSIRSNLLKSICHFHYIIVRDLI